MTFTAVVTAHRQDPSRVLGNLLYQTRPPDETLVFCSEVEDLPRLMELFPHAVFVEVENRNDWGHEKRAMGLEQAACDAVGFFNADDSYELEYVELMMRELEEGADAAYCSWSGIPRCSFACGSSTSGNFVVRTEVGRKAGYLDRHYEADGTFIERIRNEADRVSRVDRTLYYHNIQR